MKIKKIDPNWYPSENRELKVGETVEITDPKALILSGQAVAVDKNGVEISAYDLYGVIAGNEKKDFEQWLAMKKEQTTKKTLEKQEVKLKEELQVTQPEAREVATPPADTKISWIELVQKGKEAGIYKAGMSREQLEAALKPAV